MLNALIKYGSVATKARAMYGKMLTKQDWSRLSSCRDVAELTSVLRTAPGWAHAVQQLSADDSAESSTLIRAIRAQIRYEDERLYRMASHEDKKYLDFAVCRVEYEQILSALRCIMSTTRRSTPVDVSRFIEKRSLMSFDALGSALSFDDVKKAARGCLFDDILQNADASLDYAAVSVLLEKRYFSSVYDYLLNKYHGVGKALLVQAVGLEADMLNIMHILRIHRYFPGSLHKADELLIPIRQRLDDKLTRRLIAAPSNEAALSILRTSHWSFFADDTAPGGLERRFTSVMEDFYRKLIRAPIPSLCVPQAYLSLKQSEADRLIRVVQAVRLGIDPAQVM